MGSISESSSLSSGLAVLISSNVNSSPKLKPLITWNKEGLWLCTPYNLVVVSEVLPQSLTQKLVALISTIFL
ncbi:hypothetical protein BpHYR1_028458 [Brachionus plicatilis]|uniref:Uncharacterized protein n=1 Tax=Brachionus plicatilis TaxID=10195 RepID=A0A3M7RGK0_BRAPC|nr:hypothetical protein BpHYR1_028458 [Brachionus plicatilis]